MNLSDKGLIQFCSTYGIEPTGDYTVELVDARELVVANRIDLIAKIKYVESVETQSRTTFLNELYARSIEACTMGTYIEFGKEEYKNSITAFFNVFDSLIASIKSEGVNPDISVIPVDLNNMILDGAHRVAAAAYYGQKVPIIRFPIFGAPMGVELFRKRMLPEDDIAYLVTELCKWRDDLYLCCIWPAAEGSEKRKTAIDKISECGKLVYHVETRVSYNGLQNLIPQIYASHDWVGSIENRFLSATPKIDACYAANEQLDICLFECESLDKVKLLKSDMRQLFGIEENSLHITDYPDETYALAQMLLSKTTLDFLNRSTPFKYVELNKKMAAFRTKILAMKLNPAYFIVDSSAAMGLYGIRKPEDIDYLTLYHETSAIENNYINNHITELPYHKKSAAELIWNPNNYFVFFGLKVLSLKALYEFKKNRGSKKDVDDIALIKSFLENKIHIRTIVSKASLVIERNMRNVFFRLIKKLGLYEFARKVYHFIRGR